MFLFIKDQVVKSITDLVVQISTNHLFCPYPKFQKHKNIVRFEVWIVGYIFTNR